MRRLLSILGLSALGLPALLLMPSSARAQSLGAQGDFSIAIERFSGLSVGGLGIDPEGPVDEFDIDYFSLRLLTSQASSPGPILAVVPVFSTPRIGADYFVSPQLSVGGNFGLALNSWEVEDVAEPSATTFIFGGRLGYWVPINETLSFWPRGGISFLYLSLSDDDDDSEASMLLPAISLEAPLMIALGPAFLELAATLDISIAGSAETETLDFDVSAYEFGLQAGIGLAF
jgi:hypothetical protein